MNKLDSPRKVLGKGLGALLPARPSVVSIETRADDDRYVGNAGEFGCAPAAFPGDQLITVPRPADYEGLNNPVGSD